MLVAGGGERLQVPTGDQVKTYEQHTSKGLNTPSPKEPTSTTQNHRPAMSARGCQHGAAAAGKTSLTMQLRGGAGTARPAIKHNKRRHESQRTCGRHSIHRSRLSQSSARSKHTSAAVAAQSRWDSAKQATPGTVKAQTAVTSHSTCNQKERNKCNPFTTLHCRHTQGRHMRWPKAQCKPCLTSPAN